MMLSEAVHELKAAGKCEITYYPPITEKWSRPTTLDVDPPPPHTHTHTHSMGLWKLFSKSKQFSQVHWTWFSIIKPHYLFMLFVRKVVIFDENNQWHGCYFVARMMLFLQKWRVVSRLRMGGALRRSRKIVSVKFRYIKVIINLFVYIDFIYLSQLARCWKLEAFSLSSNIKPISTNR